MKTEHVQTTPRYSTEWFKTPEGIAWCNDEFMHTLTVVLRDHFDEVDAELHALPPESHLGALGLAVGGLRKELLAWAEHKTRSNSQ